MENNNSFKIGLCEVGDCESCLFSYCCSCCAIAQARTYVDNSPPIFNFCCMSHVTERWLIRSAYGIPGDACADCYTSFFCPCCAANQAYQTAKERGNPVDNGGRYANVSDFITPLPAPTATAKNYMYSCCCMPCAVGDMMERAVGMPWYLGCLCTNVPAARNVMRYQYRIKGNDVMEELAVPMAASFFTNMVQQCIPCAGCALWGAYAAVVTQLGLEAEARPALPATEPYLSGSSAPMLPPPNVLQQQQAVAPMQMAISYPPSQLQQQQGVHMGTIHSAPPPSAIQVYTHQQPIVGHAIPLSNMGRGEGRTSGYSQVSVAEPVKDHSY